MATAKKRTATKKTSTKPRAKSNVKSSLAKNKGMNWGVIAVIVGVLAIVGIFYVLLSQAGTTVNYKTADGSIVPRRFPGDPNPKVTGKAYWGSSIGGNGNPTRHETPAGKSLSVRRTFWGWDSSRTSMITTIKADLAANRLPWVSTKTPKWAQVAAGQYDAELDDMLRKVDATAGPVFLTIYHEPEDNTDSGTGREKCEQEVPKNCEGTAADWRAMQKHFRDRMNAVGTKNITLAPILMSWTWDTRSNRTPSDYWVSGIWDFYGVDHYQDGGTGAIADMASWKNFVAFTEAKGLPYGVGEWGTRGSDAAAAKRVQDFWNWGFVNKKDIIAYSYFDSGLNSPSGSWELTGDQLTTFQNILKTDTRIQRVNELGVPTSSTVSPTATVTTTTSPSALEINITSPVEKDVVRGLTTVTAEPDTNVQEVSFRLDGVWQSQDASAPFAWDWDTTRVADGEHTVTIRARKVGDPGDVYTEKSIRVTVQNAVSTPTPTTSTSPSPTPTTTTSPTPTPTTDTTKPSAPTNVKGGVVFDPLKFSYYTNLTWAAAYDNVGVTSYEVKRNGVSLGTTSSASYKDTTLQPNILYTYEVYARDAAGNISIPGTTKLTGRCFLVWCWAE